MPPDERSLKTSERCANHPSRTTVGTCDVCGRPLCVECAIPVRGRVLGAECLPEILGDQIPITPTPKPWRRRAVRSTLDKVAGGCLIVAVAATLFPWTRFGTGSGFIGAWAFDGRWSMDVVVVAVVAVGVWFFMGRRPTATRWVAIVGGAAIAVCAGLAVLNPPPFTKPALAPWLALVAGVGATVAGVLARSRTPAPHV